MTKTKVINLFGGPGIGKSTVAAGLFHLMKSKQLDVELVTEYAKDLVWDDRIDFLRKPDQIHVFAEQQYRLWRLVDKVEWIITDSPLLLSNVYTNPTQVAQIPSMLPFFLDVWQTYRNLNFVLNRRTAYQAEGRAHSEDESIKADAIILDLLEQYSTNYIRVDVDVNTPATILQRLEHHVHH